MAHLEKYNAAASGHMLKHYDRDKDSSGAYVKFGNQEIDLERTWQNYNLCKREQGSKAYLNERLSQVHHAKRKDLNVMCSWVVTLPKNVDIEREREFFESTYEFLKRRYGEENIVTADVHLDETTPHLHFAFVPVVYDQKKGIDKVSAKERVDRNELRTFHHDLQKYVSSQMGFDVEIENGIVKAQGGNKSVKQLKFETEKEHIARQFKFYEEMINTLEEQIKSLRKANKALQERVDELTLVEPEERTELDKKIAEADRDDLVHIEPDWEWLAWRKQQRSMETPEVQVVLREEEEEIE